MTERELQRFVIGHAKTRGWIVAHFGNTVKYVKTRDGHKVVPDPEGAGFPDLVLARAGRLMFAELKRKGKKPTERQMIWLDTLTGVPGIAAYVWTPDDIEEIVRVLR